MEDEHLIWLTPALECIATQQYGQMSIVSGYTFLKLQKRFMFCFLLCYYIEESISIYFPPRFHQAAERVYDFK